MYIPEDLLLVEALENTLRKVEEVLSRFAKDGISLLDQRRGYQGKKTPRMYPVRFPLFMRF